MCKISYVGHAERERERESERERAREREKKSEREQTIKITFPSLFVLQNKIRPHKTVHQIFKHKTITPLHPQRSSNGVNFICFLSEEVNIKIMIMWFLHIFFCNLHVYNSADYLINNMISLFFT